MFGFLDWWADQSPWLRYGIAFLFLGLSATALLVSGRLWFWGWGIGLGLLFCAGRSESEKKGYRF